MTTMTTIQFTEGVGCLVHPDDTTLPPPTHGLVLVQEWWGINEAMIELAHKFANEQLLCVVPDLYHGKVTAKEDEAKHLMGELDWQKAVREISAAGAYLRGQGCQWVVVAGFCMGGALAAAAAVLCADVFDGAAPFYGTPPASLCNLAETKIPIQAHFAQHDEHFGFSDVATAEKYRAALQASKVPHTLFMYDAQHAFMNARRPEVYNEACAKQGFERLVTFTKSFK